jgi:hypothetical protein
MLRDRRELMEKEIEHLTYECGMMYLKMIRSGQPHSTPEYDDKLTKVMTMKAELEMINQMIRDGFQ